MQLSLSRETGYFLASITGRIDESAMDLFLDHLHPLLGQSGSRLILDLSKSNGITSRGLGHLVYLVADANTHSNRVILAACARIVADVLERSKLTQFFEIAESVPAAIQRLFDE